MGIDAMMAIEALRRQVGGATRILSTKWGTLLAFALFLAAALAMQLYSGALQADVGDQPDEAAHFITGLMVRDYVASLSFSSPMEYAKDYYRHYPRVALGHWPPVFYIVQTAWTLVIPPSRVSMMLLMAVISALLATCVHRVVWTEFCYLGGLASGLLLLSFPYNQRFGRMVMAELLLALLGLLATLLWAKYLNTMRWRDSASFGLMASVALLTKGTGIALAVIPPVSLLLDRRLSRLCKWSFWLPAVIVVMLCGPWYYWAPGAQHEHAGLRAVIIPTGAPAALDVAFSFVMRNPGLVLIPLVLIGLYDRVVRPLFRNESIAGLWVSLPGLALSITVTGIWVMPSREPRHLTLVLPALVILMAAGAGLLLSIRPLCMLKKPLKIVLVGAITAGIMAQNVINLPVVSPRGYAQLADEILAEPAYRDSVLLVSSDTLGEGALISEVARRERRPGHVVLRAGKVLCWSSFFGNRYKIRFETTEELGALLSRIPVTLLVLDHSARVIYPHQELLQELIDDRPENWEKVGEYPRATGAEGDGGIEVFRQVGIVERPRGELQFENIPGMEVLENR